MEELFNGQLSFADIEAEKFPQIRRTHADRRVNAMDRLTDDVINELIQLCLPLYHIKANHGRPYTRLETLLSRVQHASSSNESMSFGNLGSQYSPISDQFVWEEAEEKEEEDKIDSSGANSMVL